MNLWCSKTHLPAHIQHYYLPHIFAELQARLFRVQVHSLSQYLLSEMNILPLGLSGLLILCSGCAQTRVLVSRWDEIFFLRPNLGKVVC